MSFFVFTTLSCKKTLIESTKVQMSLWYQAVMLDIESKTWFVTKPIFCLVKEKFDWNIYLIFFSATRNVCFFPLLPQER